MKNNWWKLVLILAVVIWSAFYAWPRKDRPFLNMRLGLDLKGGSHLVMQVITDDALRGNEDALANTIQDQLRKSGFADVPVAPGQTLGQVVVGPIPGGRAAEVEKAVTDVAGRDWSQSNNGNQIVLTMSSALMNYERENAAEQALNTIRNRIDQFGVSEANIQRVVGEGGQKDRILVELPGVEDPSRVKGLIQTQAQLELRLAYYRQDGTGPFIGANAEEVTARMGGQVPPGVEILPYQENEKETGQKGVRYFMAVERRAVIRGGDLAKASAGNEPTTGQPIVEFELKVAKAAEFATFTRNNVGRQMPIVLDNKIISAPRINSEIGIRGMIEGSFTKESAADLALSLRSGALPARVMTIEERTVGPSLGKDSIDAGIKASLIGSAVVCLMMLIYYRRSGINAIIALFFNLLILAAVMSSFDAVLTLPGIAGYALTVGMAVDSNVLIFERIREELRHGRTVRAAIDQGFSKALSAIFDTHVTTIVSALFLFSYGTGPVKGFAVSLTVGLLANLFTALVVSRFIFDLEVGDRPVKSLSI